MKSNNTKIALIDTTLQIDRIKMPNRKEYIENLLKNYKYSITTSIVLLEFKAVLIQECITIHNKLMRCQSFILARDTSIEKKHSQKALRSHIFNNIIQVFPSPKKCIKPKSEDDKRLAKKARQLLENIIPKLHTWFIKESMKNFGSFVKNEIQCTRAIEKPEKIRKAFRINLPRECTSKNKNCRIEKFIRECKPLIEKLCSAIKNLPDDSQTNQLKNALDIFETFFNETKSSFSITDCRRLGDCLIALEGIKSGINCALSTNAKEWDVICTALGIEFNRVSYPNENI